MALPITGRDYLRMGPQSSQRQPQPQARRPQCVSPLRGFCTYSLSSQHSLSFAQANSSCVSAPLIRQGHDLGQATRLAPCHILPRHASRLSLRQRTRPQRAHWPPSKGMPCSFYISSVLRQLLSPPQVSTCLSDLRPHTSIRGTEVCQKGELVPVCSPPSVCCLTSFPLSRVLPGEAEGTTSLPGH